MASRAVEAVAHHLAISDFGGKYAVGGDGWERFKADHPADAADYLREARGLVQAVGTALVQESLDAAQEANSDG